MKRKLTNDERKRTERGVKDKQSEVAGLGEQVVILKKYRDFLKIKREYDDFARPINRKSEDKEINSKFQAAESILEAAEYSIKEMQKHLKEGIEVKGSTMT